MVTIVSIVINLVILLVSVHCPKVSILLLHLLNHLVVPALVLADPWNVLIHVLILIHPVLALLMVLLLVLTHVLLLLPSLRLHQHLHQKSLKLLNIRRSSLLQMLQLSEEKKLN